MDPRIDSISTPSGTPPSTATPFGSSALGKNEFLKLLMAQLAHQDPTSPADSTAFVAQLAQFASVEQLQSANDRLDSLLMAQAASNQTGVASLVGRDVLFRSDAVTLTEGGQPKVTGNLAASAEEVTAVITDSSGKVVRTLFLGPQAEGKVELAWDGRNESGVVLAAGDYTVKLSATDAAGNAVTIQPQTRARVTGVSFDKGYPELLVDGRRVKLSEVLEINEAALWNQPQPTP